MAAVAVRVDTSRAIRKLAQAQGRIHRAAVQALNWTAADAQGEVQQVMRRVFDRPTPYTIRGVGVWKASGADPVAKVGLKSFGGKGTAAADFLAPQVYGGARSMKRFERALQRIGALPPGWMAVPASGAQLDAYGNMNRGQIVQILAALQAFGEQGYRANMDAKGRARLAKGSKRSYGREYFVSHGRGWRQGTGSWKHGRNQHLPAGVWMRQSGGLGKSLRPVLIFVRTATYKPRLPFHRTVVEYARREFPIKFDRAMRSVRG